MRINPYKTQIGSLLPNGVLELVSIGSTAKLLYGRLCQYSGEKGYCWPAISTLAVAIGCSKTTVKRAIKELVDANLIEVKHRFSKEGDATSNLYFFVDHAALHIHSLRGRQVFDPPQSFSALAGSETAPKENQLKEEKKNKSSNYMQAHESHAAAQNIFQLPLPQRIDAAIQGLALGQNYLTQVRCLVRKYLNSGTGETEAFACLAVFKERLPTLKNINNPCSLLAQLFRVEAGREHLEAIQEATTKAITARAAKEKLNTFQAAEQARLDQQALDWLNDEAGQKFLEWISE